MDYLFPYPKMGVSFLEILHDRLTRKLLGFGAIHAEKTPFMSGVTSRLKFLLNDPTTHISFMKLGYTVLEAFLQANVTGPPLDFNVEAVIFTESYRDENLTSLREELSQDLAVDGNRPYPLTPHIELFWLAKVILSNPILAEAGFNGRRARTRVNFWHQKLLSEESPTLRDEIYADTDVLEQQLAARLASQAASSEEHFVQFLIERAVARTYYGDDALARKDLARAATIRSFQFALTGAMGKRTKFQQRETSQLIVLAKSRDVEPPEENGIRRPEGEKRSSVDQGLSKSQSVKSQSSDDKASTMTASAVSLPHQGSLPDVSSSTVTKPADVPLNDDTLLENISFGPSQPISPETMTHATTDESSLPPALASLDPSKPTPLHPLDSIILLATASSITNTSPKDGLVREETLPYATRVLDGGSSNWQVYTQALLVRSRIEGYRARTTERGLLQLQALVDQIIAETTASAPPGTTNGSTGTPTDTTEPTTSATTFFPKPASSEAASVAERLQYIYQLSPPLRWELEAELAARWTHMGGLKTALEIYRRLQMHAEVALCLAATNREGEAIELLKDLLFEKPEADVPEEDKKAMMLRSHTPSDAPRLLCILGDITSHPDYYKLSWTVSGNRYARAQRSLARFLVKRGDYESAKEAYTLALGLNRLDRASWFSLGCVQLELHDYEGAIESFTRCVQLEDDDAESWSNLGLALLKLPVEQRQKQQQTDVTETREVADDEEEEEEGHAQTDGGDNNNNATTNKVDPYIHVREALLALRRAATLKRDDPKIWDNYLTVAAKIPPSAGTPWAEIIQAMGRVVDLRSKKEGESAIDSKILRVLTEFVTKTFTHPSQVSTTVTTHTDDNDENSSVTPGNVFDSKEDESEPGPGPQGEEEDKNTKLPYLARSFLGLVDTHVAPLVTSSPVLYEVLCDVSGWRGRPAQALGYAEKSWRTFLTSVSLDEQFDDVSEPAWNAVVDKTVWLVGKYKTLGPLERERTGGQVEPKWKFKARSAVRKVLGRAKAREGSPGWDRLSEVSVLE
ncbi:uncharacterized protein PV06_08091 [Exophiala oligosperma]|uniref:Uncharacterized protein n=1 Tax=Exophiala oligosperma TaxID=215243 RepID=A0A0D2DAQ1_9EURO|nr:uncharacterized protein PV06_08091 [Exophiala oligosperma]KIW39480.1 hypothetical protein PV06_08091 [Exophiala oligosperma]